MNIFVSNLGFHLGNRELKEIFSAYGEVTSATVITDRETNRSKGFGFVEMNNQAEAETAIGKLNGFIFEGRAMNVNEARPRESKPRKQYNW